MDPLLEERDRERLTHPELEQLIHNRVSRRARRLWMSIADGCEKPAELL
jgi:hypothetical protein